jgi:glycosyltransferase involved in cell wall biosynthesis
MRVALVHDWSIGYAGSERVLEQLMILFPAADLYMVADFIPPPERAFLRGRQPRTTFIQGLPFARRWVQRYLPLMPLAVESLDLSAYDAIISSSHAVAKGVLTAPCQRHICYCHTPLRYGWDLQHQYLRQAGLNSGWKRAAAMAALHYLRLWDARTAHGVDHFLANSGFVARRIRRVYGRRATILHPPVDTEYYDLGPGREDFFLTASRLVPYKCVDLLVESFRSLPALRLVVAGDGPALPRLRAMAPPNVEFAGHVGRHVLRSMMQRARAFVFAAEEDFGIVLAEAQSCGTPAICYGRGGALDIVADGETGVFFGEQSPGSIAAGVRRFLCRKGAWDPVFIRRRAQRFSVRAFREGFMAEFQALLARDGPRREESFDSSRQTVRRA